MIRETVHALLACIVTFVICAVAYPAAVYGLGHTLFPKQAEGSLLERDGKPIGSMLIAQPFASEKYFSPRPSAAGATGFAADAASGSNLGTTNPALRERIALDSANQIASKTGDADLKAKLDRLAALQGELKTKNDLKEKTKADEEAITQLTEAISVARTQVDGRASELAKNPDTMVPVDLVTASGAGLDPDISPEAARYQAARIAAARRVPLDRIRTLIDDHINRSGAILGAPPRVNVLRLNLDLDKEVPDSGAAAASPLPSPSPTPTTAEPAPAPAPATEVKPFAPAPIAENTVSATAVEALTGRIERLQEKLDAISVETLAAEVKDLKAQLAKLDEEPTARRMDERIEGFGRDLAIFRAELRATREASRSDEAVASLGNRLQTLQSEVGTLRESLKKAQVPDRPAVETKPTLDLDPAIEMFRAKLYAPAAASFLALTESNPDDARPWYFAALTTGFATGDWGGKTLELVGKGVQRERAGTPSAAEIDAAFADLTKETGREWLAFYRKHITER